jgi:hypothetical protein
MRSTCAVCNGKAKREEEGQVTWVCGFCLGVGVVIVTPNPEDDIQVEHLAYRIYQREYMSLAAPPEEGDTFVNPHWDNALTIRTTYREKAKYALGVMADDKNVADITVYHKEGEDW